jgi:hypothetical protein
MFPDDLIVKVIPNGQYLLKEQYRFIDIRPGGGTITVPKGFVTDFASIPRGFRWLVHGHDQTRGPAVIHDYLYRWAIGDRREADSIFEQAMWAAQVPKWKRLVCHAAVRLGGWVTWEKNRAKR